MKREDRNAMSKTQQHLQAAADRLGVPVREVKSIQDSDIGLLITTIDGATVVDVPADKPDAEGKTGLMWPEAPANYGGAFPVYTHSIPDESVVVDLAAEIPNPVATLEPSVPVEPFDRTAAELKAIDLGIAYDGVPDEELVLAIQDAEAANVAPFDRDTFIAEAETLGIAKPKRLTDDELYAAVLEARAAAADGGAGA